MVDFLKRRVAGGDYPIDPDAVAQAILTRRRASDPLQSLCSEMLVAEQASRAATGQCEPLTGDDAP